MIKMYGNVYFDNLIHMMYTRVIIKGILGILLLFRV